MERHPEQKSPSSHRARITKVAGVCHAWCQERRMYDRVLPTAFLIGVLVYLIYAVTIAPPYAFPNASLVKVKKGSTVRQVAHMLEDKHLISSARMFEFIVRVESGGKGNIVAGEYFFPEPHSVLTLATRMVAGDFELTPVRITVPEGASVKEIAAILEKRLPDFNSDIFIKEATPEEGHLYPDTYFFFPGEEPEVVLQALQANFELHMKDPAVVRAVEAFGKPFSEVLVMASLLEKEASIMQDRQVIAGILWKRISIGMPLQVDAVFPFILNKNTFELTRADLKFDSPYNTYTNKGLPPGPIGSPSDRAVLAAVTPIKTKYLFYLSDMNSQFHFSVNYAGQLANQRKYLQN